MRAPFCLLLLVLTPGALCQAPPPRVLELLEHLRSYTQEYRDKLPSLSCDESITSRWVDGDKVKREVKIEAMLRMIRDDSKADPFSDQYEFRLVNGRPPKHHFKVPYFVQSLVSNGIGFGSSTDETACFDYVLREGDDKELVLEMTAISGSTDPSCGDVLEGYHKTVVVDERGGNILHVTRSMSAEAARRNREVFFASIDYGPQKLGEQTFWLPVRFDARDSDGHRQMTATFSNFHRYTGELKILPGQVEAADVSTDR